MSEGNGPENRFPCSCNTFKLCRESIPKGNVPERALNDRSNVLSLSSFHNTETKLGFPEKRLLERLRVFKTEHRDRVLGSSPSKRL